MLSNTHRMRRELTTRWRRIEAGLPPLTDRDAYLSWAAAREQFYRDNGPVPPTDRDLARLASLKNKYVGERIFILGNGPSLNRTPLDKLEREFTFGVNRIYLLFDRISWRPTFYTTVDWRVAPDCRDEINALDGMTFFFPERFRGLLREGEDIFWYWHNTSEDPKERGFSRDLTRGTRGAGSVTGSAIQIAFHLGFDPIYLIGVDASYKVLSTVEQAGEDRFGTGVKLELVSTKDDDPNHFDPTYFGKGRRWHDPNVKRMIEGYEQCREGVRGTGRKIINATVGGQLEVFPRVDFNDLFAGPGSEMMQKPMLTPSSFSSQPDQMEGCESPPPPMIGDVEFDDWAGIEELEVVRKILTAQGIAQGCLIDVGAHHGHALAPFAERGWVVHAFEPDEKNRAALQRRIQDDWQVSVDPRACSDSENESLSFFSSSESSGISTLAPFVSSHQESQKVSTTTLAAYCAGVGITRVDLLKTDTEGYDLFVLKGFPWGSLAPSAVVCEFEDAKTVPLGYTYRHMADFLVEHGYHVYLSEWYPIVTYGVRHHWRRLAKYPCDLGDGNGWGNIMAFRTAPSDLALTASVAEAVIADQGRFIRSLLEGDAERMANGLGGWFDSKARSPLILPLKAAYLLIVDSKRFWSRFRRTLRRLGVPNPVKSMRQLF
jgi:FkbM family methyltransferase